MTVDFESERLILRFWRLMYQTYTLLKTCEDQIFEEHGLTTEQYAVLVAIKYLGEPVRISDIARWLERSTNSISMIVDRMVKAGLLGRKRSRGDRREVRVTVTSKAETAIKPATLAGLEFVRKILSPLSSEDRRTFVSLLETLRYEILGYCNHGLDMKEMVKNEPEQEGNLRKWLLEYASPSTPKAKRPGTKKGKTI